MSVASKPGVSLEEDNLSFPSREDSPNLLYHNSAMSTPILNPGIQFNIG